MLYIVYTMAIAQVTQAGNVFIPKQWREELGIILNSSVLLEKKNHCIIIQPLRKKNLQDAFKDIDEEIKRKKIHFTLKEAIQDDFYG